MYTTTSTCDIPTLEISITTIHQINAPYDENFSLSNISKIKLLLDYGCPKKKNKRWHAKEA